MKYLNNIKLFNYFIAIFIITTYLISNVLLSWGPFSSCGVNNPNSIEDCLYFNMKDFEFACCLVEYPNNKNKDCILIGGLLINEFKDTDVNKNKLYDIDNLELSTNILNSTVYDNFKIDIRNKYSSTTLNKKAYIKCSYSSIKRIISFLNIFNVTYIFLLLITLLS